MDRRALRAGSTRSCVRGGRTVLREIKTVRRAPARRTRRSCGPTTRAISCSWRPMRRCAGARERLRARLCRGGHRARADRRARARTTSGSSTPSSAASPSSSTCGCGPGSGCATSGSVRRSPAPRHGQEEAAARARRRRPARAVRDPSRGPTGFGKTGVLLERALGELRDGRLRAGPVPDGQVDRPAPGGRDAAHDDGAGSGPRRRRSGRGVARAEQVGALRQLRLPVRAGGLRLPGRRREALAGERALAVLPLEGQPRDLASLRSAGVGARICPYEITRAALAFNDVWIGDYNYVFSPESRGALLRAARIRPGAHAPGHRRGPQSSLARGRRPFARLLGG